MPSKSSAKAYSTGRVTPRKGQVVAPAGARKQFREAMANKEPWELNQSKSVQSGWVWRGFLMLTLFAIGAAIVFLGNHYDTLAILWGVIALGWFAVAMFLWRKHSQYLRS